MILVKPTNYYPARGERLELLLNGHCSKADPGFISSEVQAFHNQRVNLHMKKFHQWEVLPSNLAFCVYNVFIFTSNKEPPGKK